MSGCRFGSLSPVVVALAGVASIAAGCASRVVVNDEPPRRPTTTSSLPPPQRLAAPMQTSPATSQPVYRWNQSPTRIQEGAAKPAAAAMRPAVKPAPGQRTIVAEPGDTLYSLSRKHRVSMSALMDANRLRSPAVQPGDRLVLPR